MCETWLGENEVSCCRDCGCSTFGPEFFCYVGGDPDGECVDNSSINFRITGSEPSPWQCIIGRIGGECIYLNKHIINTHVVNSPSDLEIIDAYYSIDGQNATSLHCIKTAKLGDWDCALIPDNVAGSGGPVEREIEIFATVGYSLNKTDVVDSLYAKGEFTTSRDKSEALLSCEEEIERLRKQISNLESNQGGYEGWGWLYYVIGAVMIVIGVIMIYLGYAQCSAYGGCNWALIIAGALMVVTGGVQVAMGLMSQDEGTDLDTQKSQLEDLIAQKEQMCSSEEFEDMASASQGINPLSPVEY
jgi:hypothetical protein